MNKQIEKMSKRRQEYLKFKPFADDLRKAESWCDLDGVLNRYQTVKNLYKMGYRKQSEGEWISVDERFPERNGRYLTHCNIEGQSLVCILYYSKVGGFNEGAVTHWMPLPEAPKMKGEETDA